MLFGENKALQFDGGDLRIVEVGGDCARGDLDLFDEGNSCQAYMLARSQLLTPVPVGVIHAKERQTLEEETEGQRSKACEGLPESRTSGESLKRLFRSAQTWTI